MTNTRSRLAYLDVYKGLCILFVIITHYDWPYKLTLYLLFPFWIDMAVPVFMVITGYLSAMSFQKKEQTLTDSYRPVNILCRWLRFIIPVVPILVFQAAVYCIANRQTLTFSGMLFDFAGGQGAGSFFIPVILQAALATPLLWHLIRKYREKGLAVCFAVNVLYEIFKKLVSLNYAVYRMCFLRYTFILAYGVYLFVIKDEKQENRIGYDLAGLAGFVYLVIFKYTPAAPLFTDQWITTSVFAVLFIVPVMLRLMKPNHISNRLLETLGRASFNIYLIQMVWYWDCNGLAEMLNKAVPTIALRLVVIITVCCTLGVLFYRIENPITQRIIKKIRTRTTTGKVLSERYR